MNCGDIIGSYQLETALAGFPSAWCARHMATGQLFQLAVQQVDVNEPKILAVMKDVANFQNDVIKPVLEFGVVPDIGIWTISELEERPKVLDNSGLAPRDALDMCFVIARALEAAHDAALSHGSLSLERCHWDGAEVSVTGWGNAYFTEQSQEDARLRDIVFLEQLTASLLESPPAPVRSLIQSRPKTIAAYRRALAAAIGAMPAHAQGALLTRPLMAEDVDEDESIDLTVETDSPLSELKSWPNDTAWNQPPHTSETSPISPIAKTEEVQAQDMASWLATGQAKWQQKSPVKSAVPELASATSPAPDPSDDSWGVSPPAELTPLGQTVERDLPSGLRIHTVSATPGTIESAAKRSGPPFLLLAFGIALAALGVWYIFEPALHNKPQATPPEQPSSRAESPAKRLEVAQAALGSSTSTEMDGGATKYQRAFEIRTHVPATIRRVTDNQAVCVEQSICRVPLFEDDEKTIDTHYSVSSPQYQVRMLKGFEIFDLRHKGHMRIVLKRK